MSYIIGTMSWGRWGQKWNQHQMSDFISYAQSHGLNTFDMADIYGDHTTEAEFGPAWKLSGLSRDQLVFITKTGIVMEKFSKDGLTKYYDHSAEYIIQSCEKSLKNLQTDYIDVYLIHRPGPLMAYDEMAEAAIKLKKEGKIREFGVSNFTASQMNVLSDFIPLYCNQIECSIKHYDPMINGDLDHCIKGGIIPMAWAPLGKVFAENSVQNERITQKLKLLSEKYNCPQDIILYKWLQKHPSGIIPVVGTTQKERLFNGVQYQDLTLTTIDWYDLWTASLGHKVP